MRSRRASTALIALEQTIHQLDEGRVNVLRVPTREIDCPKPVNQLDLNYIFSLRSAPDSCCLDGSREPWRGATDPAAVRLQRTVHLARIGSEQLSQLVDS